MKSRPNRHNSIVTEWEDNVLFDADDPDFCDIPSNIAGIVLNTTAVSAPSLLNNSLMVGSTIHRKVSPETATANTSITATASEAMSIASVHAPQFTDIYSSLGRSAISMSSSLNDLVGSPLEISVDNVLTIEELRQQMGSCFTCGVSWTDDHVSLDCSECGGYSLERPCPLCDGKCGVQWKRDFTMSHACGKARWHGVCPSYPEAILHLNTPAPSIQANATPATCATAASQLRLAKDLCSRLEQLSAHT